jgi:Mg2+/Co2+ transporter CorB
MSDVPIGALFGALVFLVILSGFFSGSETALMSLNRYRLRHLAKAGQRGAVRASRLLERPDRLIGLILLGNNFVNILASSLATVIALELIGEAGIAIAAGLLTLVILIFAEVAPKTLAALHPERVAFPATLALTPLLKLLYPIVWVINVIANALLRLLGVSAQDIAVHHLSTEELRTVVNEAGAMIPRRHQRMLLSILDLEKVTVEDIMVPRNEIVGIDLDDDWDEIVAQITGSQYTRLPVYREGIDNVAGIVHLRQIMHMLLTGRFSRDDLLATLREPYFIPEGTPLNKQLLNFQHQKQRIGLVVDEYGDIRGLVTLEDILEEIVGEFTTAPGSIAGDVYPQPDGTYLVDGSANIRDLNRAMNWSLPTAGPKTLNGLILEYLESIPQPGTSLRVAGYPIEIVQTRGNAVKMARIKPALARH